MKALVRAAICLVACPPAARAAQIVPVTGIHTGLGADGSPPPRLTIQELFKSGPAWDLYIQGLTAFKNVSEDVQLSYLQISGIHGRPHISYNGVEQVEGGPDTGYCTHNEVLFAIWHRPMVVLFEQVLAAHIQTAAARYQGDLAAVYREAADSWRHPYWDWAVDNRLPDVLVQPNLTIRGPHGATTVDNPLVSYRFQNFPLNQTLFPLDCDDDLATYPQTLRCLDRATNTSQPDVADDNLFYIDLAGQVYNIYTRVFDFGQMSTTARDSSSFENQHNEVHQAVGGLHPMGHFAQLGYSGFDPIFMMHHTAIDRHVALWQAVHHNASMFTETYPSAGQFATAPGTNISAHSPLKPFYASEDGTFVTAYSARDVAVFGYTYPELRGNYSSPEELGRAVTAHVNRLYGPKTTSLARRRLRARSGKEYFVRLSVEKSEVDLPAMINVRLGSYLAGRLVLLSSPRRGVMHGEVALQRALSGAAGVDVAAVAATSGAVREYLKQNVRWEVVRSDGTQLPAKDIVSLRLFMREENVVFPQNHTQFPEYRNAVTFWDSATDDRTEAPKPKGAASDE